MKLERKLNSRDSFSYFASLMIYLTQNRMKLDIFETRNILHLMLLLVLESLEFCDITNHVIINDINDYSKTRDFSAWFDRQPIPSNNMVTYIKMT